MGKKDIVTVMDKHGRSINMRRDALAHMGTSLPPEDVTIQFYTLNMIDLQRAIKRDRKYASDSHFPLYWSLLRDARIFHLPETVYQELEQVFEQHMVPKLFPHVQFTDMPWNRKRGTDSIIQGCLRDHLHDVCETAPMPANMPFSNCYIGYGLGIPMSHDDLSERLGTYSPETQDYSMSHLMGSFISDSGHAFEIYHHGWNEDGDDRVEMRLLRDPQRWKRTFSCCPWLLPMLIEFINEHKTFVIESGMSKRAKSIYKNSRKSMGIKGKQPGWIPPPYYKLELRTTIREAIEHSLNPPTGKTMTYRHDVRGHERVRVRRGAKPIDTKIHKDLLQRGYTIYENVNPPNEISGKLVRRKILLKGNHEWLAIKTSWVDDHQSPSNPDLPYVPALRVKSGKDIVYND